MNVSFDIVTIQTFDEVNSLFSVMGVVYMTWIDSRIVWDSDLHGGIGSQLYPSSEVWYPVLMLGNAYDSMTDIATNGTNVRFFPNGFASFGVGSVFKTTCSADVTYYPFDTQVRIHRDYHMTIFISYLVSTRESRISPRLSYQPEGRRPEG